jgi:hypothetical protein
MMQELLDLEKIYVWAENSQYFTNKRAVSELKSSRKFQEKQQNNIAKRWENNDLPDTMVHTKAIPKGIPPQDHKTGDRCALSR